MFQIQQLAKEIEKRSEGRLVSYMHAGAESVSVSRFAPISHAQAEHVAFLAQSKYREAAKNCQAGVIVVTQADFDAMYEGGDVSRPVIVTENPYAWFAWAMQIMTERPLGEGRIDPRACVHEGAVIATSAVIEANAVIEKGAVIGERVHVYPGAYVGEGTRVGDDSILYANVTVYHGCTLGRRVILHSGCVIGADGFGFAPFKGEWVKIPQVGGVTLGDDVEIGANTTIDRGALEDTVVGRGSKLDNQIQLGHNDKIGECTVMAACTGVAGSTSIGSHCMIGGAANINGHISIPDMAVVGPATTITHWDPSTKQMFGIYPAQDRAASQKSAVMVMRLGEMRQKIRALEAQVEALTKNEE